MKCFKCEQAIGITSDDRAVIEFRHEVKTQKHHYFVKIQCHRHCFEDLIRKGLTKDVAP